MSKLKGSAGFSVKNKAYEETAKGQALRVKEILKAYCEIRGLELRIR